MYDNLHINYHSRKADTSKNKDDLHLLAERGLT